MSLVPSLRPVCVEVIAPARLHFGLLSFGHPTARQGGGAGVALATPRLALRVSPAARFEAAGPLAARVIGAVERYCRLIELPRQPDCRIEVLEAPEEHLGLGTGTQLALSVVAALNAFRGGEPLLPAVLAAIAGRAARSAIGTYAFASGGLLAETGKYSEQLLAPLEKRVELPSDWRFVLIRTGGEPGLSGHDEQGAFEHLPPVPRSTTARLLDELSEMFSAATAGEFERFGDSLYRFGYMAGLCFASKQGGPFASPRLAELVDLLRELGVRGVGQSSWGPTLFALAPSHALAHELADRIRPRLDSSESLSIAEPNNSGARITRVEL